MKYFLDSETTEKLIKLLNDVFDVMNRRRVIEIVSERNWESCIQENGTKIRGKKGNARNNAKCYQKYPRIREKYPWNGNILFEDENLPVRSQLFARKKTFQRSSLPINLRVIEQRMDSSTLQFLFFKHFQKLNELYKNISNQNIILM